MLLESLNRPAQLDSQACSELSGSPGAQGLNGATETIGSAGPEEIGDPVPTEGEEKGYSELLNSDVNHSVGVDTMCYLNLVLSFTPQRELGCKSMHHTNPATTGIRTCDSQIRHSASTS